MPCPICDSNDHDSQCTDREAVRAAVGKDGRALWPAPDELKADKDVFEAAKASMIKAVGQDGLVLEYASDELKADKEVVLAAVGQNGDAVEHATDELRGGGIVAFVHEQARVFATFNHFLVAIHFDGRASAPLPHPSKRCRVRMLFSHGPHSATNFKRLIADFAGVPRGRAWAAVLRAKPNLRPQRS